MRTCPVCGVRAEDTRSLAAHFVAEAARSDVAHVMWLNRNVTKHRVDADRLAQLLEQRGRGHSTGEGRVNR